MYVLKQLFYFFFRTYGPLKDEFKTPPGRYLRRAVSDAPTYRTQPLRPQMATERPDVLPGPSDVPDNIQERLYGTLGVRGKDSVARMTWDGLSYVVAVSSKLCNVLDLLLILRYMLRISLVFVLIFKTTFLNSEIL